MGLNLTDTPMMRLVRQTFRTEVKYIDIHGELKASLLRNNPLVEQFIKNISGQFEKVNALRVTKGKPALKKKTLEDTIIDFTKMMVRGIELQATRKQESDMAKYAREHKDDHIKEMEKTLAGETSGAAFEELGLELGKDEVHSLEPGGVVIQ